MKLPFHFSSLPNSSVEHGIINKVSFIYIERGEASSCWNYIEGFSSFGMFSAGYTFVNQELDASKGIPILPKEIHSINYDTRPNIVFLKTLCTWHFFPVWILVKLVTIILTMYIAMLLRQKTICFWKKLGLFLPLLIQILQSSYHTLTQWANVLLVPCMEGTKFAEIWCL